MGKAVIFKEPKDCKDVFMRLKTQTVKIIQWTADLVMTKS